jgi:hypothetical protein
MARTVLCCILAVTTLPAAVGKSILTDGRSFLGNGMQPEVVARTLAKVEDEWQAEATHFMRCELAETKADVIKDCDTVPEHFSKSCSTVVNAIVQGSGGDLTVTKEYLVDVCSQSSMQSWRRDSCVSLARDVTRAMSASTYENRNSFQPKVACDTFWGHFLQTQKAVHSKDYKAIEERQKKAAEDAARLAKKEKEEAEKRAEEKAEAEKLQKEAAAKKKLADAKAQKEAEMEALRQKIKKDEERRNSKDAAIARMQAVEEAAEQSVKAATQIEEGTEDKSPKEMKAHDVLSAADAAQMPDPKMDVPTKAAPSVESNSTKVGVVAAAPRNETVANASIA